MDHQLRAVYARPADRTEIALRVGVFAVSIAVWAAIIAWALR